MKENVSWNFLEPKNSKTYYIYQAVLGQVWWIFAHSLLLRRGMCSGNGNVYRLITLCWVYFLICMIIKNLDVTLVEIDVPDCSLLPLGSEEHSLNFLIFLFQQPTAPATVVSWPWLTTRTPSMSPRWRSTSSESLAPGLVSSSVSAHIMRTEHRHNHARSLTGLMFSGNFYGFNTVAINVEMIRSSRGCT